MAENYWDNPFGDWLAESPQATYFGYQDQWGQRPQPGRGFQGQTAQNQGQKRYYQNQFQNIHNQWLGEQARLMTQGQQSGTGYYDALGTPPSFSQFLETMPWTQRYAALPPALRGAGTSQFNPQTRWF